MEKELDLLWVHGWQSSAVRGEFPYCTAPRKTVKYTESQKVMDHDPALRKKFVPYWLTTRATA
jgi:hypothetical protein